MGLDKNKVEKFIAAAMKYKGDKYSQPKRMERGYSDCSSLIYKALRDVKLLDNSKTTRTISTKFMRDGDPRFKQIPKSQLKRGDILWGQDNTPKYGGHVAIYLGDGKTIEARVREGVDYNKNRPYFTRVYRIKTLEQTLGQGLSQGAPKKVIENVPIQILGRVAKQRGYIVEGITYVDLDKKGIPVRKFFEMLGYTVDWDGTKVIIK